MDPRLNAAFTELLLAIVKGLKVLFVYIVPAVLVAVLSSGEFRNWIEGNPALVAYVPMINVAIVVLFTLVKNRLPEDSGVRKVL